MLHLAEISSDHIDQERCLYAYCTQNINGSKLVLEAAHYHVVVISQHGNFMLLNFMHFRILIFLFIPVRAMRCLDQHVGLVFLYSRRFPEDGIMVPKHVGV